MGSKATNFAASLLPLAALAIAPVLGLGALGSMLLVGAASLAGSLITKESFTARGKEELRINSRTTQKTIPVVYGKNRIGSNDVFIEMTGKDEKTLWIVHCVSEGICEGIETDPANDKPFIYIDGQKLYDDPTAQPKEYKSPFKDLVEWWFHNGDPELNSPVASGTFGGNKQVNAALHSAVPDFDDRMPHTAYMVFKIKFDTDVFTTIPAREVILKGLKIYDFRVSVTEYNRNPVVVLYDYITNDRYGLGWDSALLDASGPLSSWSIAANYCDTHDPSWQVDIGIGNQRRSQDIIEMILSHFRGGLTWSGGLLNLFYKDATPEVADIGDKDIARGDNGKALIQVTQPSTHFVPSSVIVKYVSEAAAWTLDDVSIGELYGQLKRIDFLGFTNRRLAFNMAYYALERMKLNRTITVTLRASNMYLENGDVVSVSASELGMFGQRMRVVSSNILPTELTQVVLVYDPVTLYNDAFDPLEPVLYENSLANPDLPPGPVRNISVVATKFTDRNVTYANLFVSFDPPDENSVYYKDTDVSIKKGQDGTWSQSFRVTQEFEVPNATIFERYFIRFRTVNIREVIQPINEAITVEYTVLGHSTPPICPFDIRATVNITSISLYSSPTGEADLEYYEFRLGQPGDSWNDSIFMSSIPLPALSYSGVKPGQHQFMVSPLRNDGQYCPLPPMTIVTLEDPPPFHNIIHEEVLDYDCGTGVCDNVEIIGSPAGWLKCSHTNSDLTGYYTSYEITVPGLTADVWYLAYLVFDYAVVGIGDTWNDIWPSPTTWEEGSYPPLTWLDLVGNTTAAPKLNVEMSYDNGSISGVINRMEILSGLFIGDTLTMHLEITDVSNNSFLTLEPPTLYVCERITSTPYPSIEMASSNIGVEDTHADLTETP